MHNEDGVSEHVVEAVEAAEVELEPRSAWYHCTPDCNCIVADTFAAVVVGLERSLWHYCTVAVGVNSHAIAEYPVVVEVE